ncbi:hypothetical protein [Pseudomonas sp.]|uniref:hypothetical protein n=2 Tax=unclassified Pseudomonas TaxID=196821 RepID=UPI003A973481
MGEIKAALYGMYDVIVFPCLVVFIFCVARIKKAYARALFVFGCSLPVTVYCYIVYIYEGQRAWVHWSVVAIDLLAFSQIGWLGAALMFFGCLADEDSLKKTGVVVSGVSVACHGFFLVVGLVWNWLSV